MQIINPVDFESTFFEIHFPKKKIVCCVLGIQLLKSQSASLLPIDIWTLFFKKKIGAENKQCILMGDFNIDLLRINSHNDSNEFYALRGFCEEKMLSKNEII